MVLIIQMVGILFGLGMLYLTFLNWKRKEFTGKEYGVWIVLWIAFCVVALFPQILDSIVINFAFARRLDVLIISGFIFIVALTFHTYRIVRASQKKVEDVVRAIAIKGAEERKEKKGK